MVYLLCILLLGLLIIPETPITPIINGAKSWYAFGPLVFNLQNL